MVTLNNYTNTAITIIVPGQDAAITGGGTTSTMTPVSSVMSKITADGTGIVIGSLPAIESTARSGILGYLSKNEMFGFFDNGTCFIGKQKEIELNSSSDVVIKAGTITLENSNNYNTPISDDGDGTTDKKTIASLYAAKKLYQDISNLQTDKQDKLTSGENIKTINNNSILGSGNISVGTVTSVRVQGTSPINSSINTEQTGSLNTTISLADNYGDTKNPYASKTKNYILAAPSNNNGVPTFRSLTAADLQSALGEGIPITDIKIKVGTGIFANTYNVSTAMIDGNTVLVLTQ